jgi:hypothetical protein
MESIGWPITPTGDARRRRWRAFTRGKAPHNRACARRELGMDRWHGAARAMARDPRHPPGRALSRIVRGPTRGRPGPSLAFAVSSPAPRWRPDCTVGSRAQPRHAHAVEMFLGDRVPDTERGERRRSRRPRQKSCPGCRRSHRRRLAMPGAQTGSRPRFRRPTCPPRKSILHSPDRCTGSSAMAATPRQGTPRCVRTTGKPVKARTASRCCSPTRSGPGPTRPPGRARHQSQQGLLDNHGAGVLTGRGELLGPRARWPRNNPPPPAADDEAQPELAESRSGTTGPSPRRSRRGRRTDDEAIAANGAKHEYQADDAPTERLADASRRRPRTPESHTQGPGGLKQRITSDVAYTDRVDECVNQSGMASQSDWHGSFS